VLTDKAKKATYLACKPQDEMMVKVGESLVALEAEALKHYLTSQHLRLRR